MIVDFKYKMVPPLRLQGGDVLQDFEFSPHRFICHSGGKACSVHKFDVSILKGAFKILSTAAEPAKADVHLKQMAEHLKVLIYSKEILETNQHRLKSLPAEALPEIRSSVKAHSALFQATSFPWSDNLDLFNRCLQNGLATLHDMQKRTGDPLHQAHFALLQISESMNKTATLFTVQGCTILHYAAMTAEMRNVKYAMKTLNSGKLLKALSTEDNASFTPLDYINAEGRLPQFYKLFSAETVHTIKDLAAKRHAVWHTPSFQMLVQNFAGKQDWFGRTGLHWSALYGQTHTIQDILKHPAGQKCKETLDIFGHTPFDLALQKGLPKADLQLLTPKELLQKGLQYGKFIPHIDHDTILTQFRRYYKVEERDLSSLNQSGICNAASFLFTIQPTDQFITGLETLATWNGEKLSLHTKLKQLFENTISAMHWFQESLDCNEKDEQSLPWLKRKLAVVNSSLELVDNEEIRERQFDATSLRALLKTFQPKHRLNLFLGGSGHATAIKVRHGNFLYYDINLPFRIRTLSSATELANLIATTKYRMLKYSEEPMHLKISAYRVQNK